MTQQHLVNVPTHLRQYVTEQDYSVYNAIDHAVWRYVMRINISFLSGHAHPAYVPGLKAAGILTDEIPNVHILNENLGKFGWGAVVVDGFIPSSAFFEFQAHGILPISVDIRSLEHIQYTPAPDIIHETAGHAPILFDEHFAEYVKVVSDIGVKALSTKEEHDIFDAVRHLTKVMENPLSTKEEIIRAEHDLAEKRKAEQRESEESWVSRLHWWTVEYGLIGEVTSPKIYGAGLLSSVMESKYCLTDAVRKIPFDLEACIRTPFDVTRPQPQLFVCERFEQLIEAARQLSLRMAFKTGGTQSLIKAIDSGRLATFVYSSGIQVSGTVTEIVQDLNGDAIYVKTSDATSLAFDGKELTGHGKEHHAEGFGSPIGLLESINKPIEDLTEAELTNLKISVGNLVQLSFRSGVRVEGTVRHILRIRGRVVLISFTECLVSYQNKVLFAPSSGVYDMAVGEKVTSVFAGAADVNTYFAENTQTPTQAMVAAAVSTPDEVTLLEQLYRQVRNLRKSAWTTSLKDTTNSVVERLNRDFPTEWLLRLELLEIIIRHDENDLLAEKLLRQLQVLAEKEQELYPLINAGLDLLRLSVG